MGNDIQKVAVLGAGVMGSAIAGLVVGSGARALLLDIVPKELDEDDKAKGLTKESPAFRGKLALAGIERLQDKKMGMLYSKTQLPLIEPGNFEDDMARLAECDWIVEAVTERLDIKQSVMARVAQCRKRGSIVSTNTSGISINAIGEGQDDEFLQHFLGTHFFNPPRFMHLFELIPGKETLPEVTARMSDFGGRCLGKGIVVAKDTPNFIGNRIGVYASIQAMRLMEKYGLDIPTVDQLTGPAMGHPKSATFRTMDMAGLDVFYHVADNVVNADVDTAEKDRFRSPDIIKGLVAAGAFGDKAGKGFFQKSRDEDGKRVVKVYDPQSKDYIDFEKPKPEIVSEAKKSDNKYAALVYDGSGHGKFCWELTRDISLYAAEKAPEIADDYREIDKAMNWGFNWKLGPFQMWDAIGVERSVKRMKDEGFTVPAWVEARLAEGKAAFYEENDCLTPYIKLGGKAPPVMESNDEAQLRDLGDGVLLLEFTAPGNSIGQNTMALFDRALEDYLAKSEWVGLVIGNQGDMFSAGANLVTIGFGIQQGDWKSIEEGIATYQNTNMRLKYCGKPIVTAPFSRVLGGGAECVMHSDCAVASVETYMGLVEVGVGLLPGAGGNKEILMRHYEAASSDKPADLLPKLLEAWQLVAMATFSANAFDAIDKHFLRPKDTRVVMNQDAILDEAKRKAISLAADGYMPPKPGKIKALGDYGRAVCRIGVGGLVKGGFASEYDAHIAMKIAWVMTGGDAMKGALVEEQYLLDLEREAFLSLCGEEKTRERLLHMMNNRKPLRN
ncbi:MAG: 3-hydroxyacyl-CoA dehydrogenase/enoyl-CoA hydratase family protein [Clostridiales Family XIII bacterium]|jgi:3-hydroxyacyl-CoA dehydrogenase|nr:3-hydroxyacyl-CoA dehydrogenase/enoyl-CoA hydratase family protein [Clostridiales Family XIII bacterium]